MEEAIISLTGRHVRLVCVVANIVVIVVAILDFARLYLRLVLRLLPFFFISLISVLLDGAMETFEAIGT